MPFFYLLAALVVLQSVMSLRGGLRYLNFFRRELDSPRALYMPFASVFVPCRGVDQGLRLNLLALFRQHYPAYELVFVSDRADDPALEIARQLARELEGETVARTRFVVAGKASDSGQKVHNLRAALKEAGASGEVFVFVDTDARPRADWLRALVAPLADEGAGAATGYRWFLPARGGLASHLRSVWNASIASALGAIVWPLVIVSVVFLLGLWKAFFRLRAVALVLEEHHERLRRGVWAHLLLWPLTAALFLYNALAAGLSRRIVWRGIGYELK